MIPRATYRQIATTSCTTRELTPRRHPFLQQSNERLIPHKIEIQSSGQLAQSHCLVLCAPALRLPAQRDLPLLNIPRPCWCVLVSVALGAKEESKLFVKNISGSVDVAVAALWSGWSDCSTLLTITRAPRARSCALERVSILAQSCVHFPRRAFDHQGSRDNREE